MSIKRNAFLAGLLAVTENAEKRMEGWRTRMRMPIFLFGLAVPVIGAVFYILLCVLWIVAPLDVRIIAIVAAIFGLFEAIPYLIKVGQEKLLAEADCATGPKNSIGGHS